MLTIHDTKSCYSKVFEVKHTLKRQVAREGAYRGSYLIDEGHPQIHQVVLDLLKIDVVWRVVVDEGYFMITISRPEQWPKQSGEIAQTLLKGLL